MKLYATRFLAGSLAVTSALSLVLSSVPAMADGYGNQGLPSYAQGAAPDQQGDPNPPQDQGGPQDNQGAPQDPSEQGDQGVARISDVAGGVHVRRSDNDDEYAAALNAPVSPGDYITTQNDARAEIEFDYASLVRVAPDTQIRFTQLDPNAHTLQLAEGTVELRVLRGLDAHPVVETPASTIRPDESGQYRVTVTHDGDTKITVRSGRADITVGDGFETQTLSPGSTLVITGQGADAHAQTVDAVAYQDFDKWTDDRDMVWAHAGNYAYVDHGMVGAEDLGQYGQWSNNTNYGQVWTPSNEPAGWSPYTDGRWVWEPYYGWTWVGNEPWGYAPYHYGRWFYSNSAWSWYPGPYDTPNPYVYAPACVGFFGYGDGGGGGGGGININLDFGGGGGGFAGIGWTPLAPFEALLPWWGTAIAGFFSLFGNGNSGYNGYGYGHGYSGYGNGGFPHFRNAGAPGGMLGVSGSNFASGNFEHIQPLHSSGIGSITPIKSVLPVVPTTHNLGANPRATDPVERSTVASAFSRFSPLKNAVPGFNAERQTVAGVAKDLYPRLAPAIDRQMGADRTESREAAYAPNRTANVSAERAIDSNRSGSAWDRFGNSESTTRNYSNERESVAPREGDVSRTNDAWGRFGDRGYSAPERSYSAPERSYSSPERSYSSPERSYSSPERSYSSPERSYSSPERSYSAPERSYSSPGRSYSAPERSYSAPERSYSAPRYSAPRYSAPRYSAPHYSAPHYSAPRSSPSRGSSGGGKNQGSSRRR